MRLFVRLAGTMSAVLLVGSLGVSRPADSGYHLLKTYRFGAAPGSTSEYFDYITVDSAARRVYLSRGTAVEVMNADTGAEIGYIGGFKRQHGVALAPEFGRGFISDGTMAQVTIFDLKTLKTLGQAKADPDTDCIVYDPASKRVFTMNGDSHSSTVIDAKTGTVVRAIDLIGSPEFAVADGKGMIYANLANKDEVAAIDTRTMEVKSRWPTAPSGGSTALAMDREHRRLFSAGRKPQFLVIMDADSGKVIQSFPITAGTDAVAYDPETKLIFVSTQEGEIHIFHEDSPDQYSMADTVHTQFGAKTMGLDAKTHRLFVDTSDFSASAPATADRPNPRPATVLGTFRVLVYGRQ
jgi:DNA-binding beta-propeller fold protein YncE